MLSLLLCCASLALSPANIDTADWPGFRGPNGSGVLETAAAIPEKIDKAAPRWRTEIPAGYSSPVVAGDHIFVTASEGRSLFTIAIQRENGEIAWRQEAPAQLKRDPRGPNSPVAPSPAVDAERVYVFFPNFGLIAYTHAGEEAWQLPLGPFNNPYGMGTSPIIAGDMLLLLCDQDTGSFLLAVAAADGKEKWRADRKVFTHGFSSPVIHRPQEGEAEVIVSGSYEVCGYSLETGEKLWWITGMAWQAKSIPSVHGDRLYLHSWMAGVNELGLKNRVRPWAEIVAEFDKDDDGKLSKEESPDPGMARLWFLYDLDDDQLLDENDWKYLEARAAAKNGLYGIELGGRGDVTKTHVLWRYNRALPNIPSPILYRGVLYMLKEGGIFSSIDPDTGKELGGGRLLDLEDTYYASPIAAGGRLLTASKAGIVTIVKADAKWERLDQTEFEEEIWGTPALAEDGLYIRTQKALYAF